MYICVFVTVVCAGGGNANDKKTHDALELITSELHSLKDEVVKLQGQVNHVLRSDDINLLTILR